MVDVTQVVDGVQDLSVSLQGLDFFLWIIVAPIGLEILLTLLLRRVVGDELQGIFASKLFGIVYMVVMYAVCLAIVSFLFNILMY